MKSERSGEETQEVPALRTMPALGAEPGMGVPTPASWVVPAELRASRAFLTMLTGPQPGRAFAFSAYIATLGRDADCTIPIDDPAVSRKHASVLRLPNGVFIVKDLASTNGTFVRSERIVSGTKLEAGDRLQLGPSVSFRFGIGDDLELELQQHLYESATYDLLTGALNRASFFRRFEIELRMARRHAVEVSLLMIDVDHFKQVNDSLGHAAGDELLRRLGEVLHKAVRTCDVIGRYGGEELVILGRATRHADALGLAERLRGAVEAALPITISIGVASSSEVPVSDDGSALSALADQRVYLAKAAGRNRVVG